MAGKRCVPELCGGAGGVPDFGEPGPGGGHCWLFADADASGRDCLRRGAPAGTAHEDSNVCELRDACSVVRGADDRVDGGLAVHGEREDGSAAGANGIDSGDSGGESAAGGVQPIASNFGFARKRRLAGRTSSYLLDGEGVSR